MAPTIPQPVAERTGIPVLGLVCLLTFVHYASAQMRTLVLPLYASAHGATAHYGAIAIGPFLGGLAAQRWGYRAALVAISVALAGSTTPATRGLVMGDYSRSSS